MKHYSAKNICAVLAFCGVTLAALNASAKSWFYVSDSTTHNYGLTNVTAWADGSSNPATQFNKSDKYYVKSGHNLRFLNGTWNGGAFYFGEPSSTTDTKKIAYGTFEGGYLIFNSDVHFDYGSLRVYQYVNGQPHTWKDLRLEARSIIVGSPLVNPFYVRCGLVDDPSHIYNNRRLVVNAPVSSSDSSVGFRIGGDSSPSTNLTVALTGDCSGYTGTMLVKTFNADATAVGNWDTCLMLGDTTVGGAVQLDAKTGIEARIPVNNSRDEGAPSECTVGSLSLAANSVIVVSGDTATPTNGIIHVRDSLSVTGPVYVKFRYDPHVLGQENRVTVLTAPMTSSLSAGDFTLELSDVLGGYTPLPYWGFEVEEDAEAGIRSLVAVFRPYEWYYSGDDSNNMGFPDAASWNPALWTNAFNDAASAFDTTDHYVVIGSMRMELDGATFPGGTLHLGLPNGNASTRHLRIATTDGTVNFPNGLCLDSGTCEIFIQDKANPDAVHDCAIDADLITVQAPVSSDFRFASQNNSGDDNCYDNRRLFINAPMASDKNSGVVLGVKGDSRGTNLTFVINGDCSEYMGRIRTRGARDLPLGQWDTRVGFGDIAVGGTLWVQECTAISAWKGVFGAPSDPGTPTECTVGAIYFKTNSVILVEGNTTTPTNGIFHVRGSVTVEQRPAGMTDPSVTVRFNYDPQIPHETRRVTVLTVPLSSDLDADDFRIDLGSATVYSDCSFVVETDAEADVKSLVAVFAPVNWYLKPGAASSPLNEYAFSDPSVWTNYSGVAAESFNPYDDYHVVDAALYVKSDSGNVTFSGGPVFLGEEDGPLGGVRFRYAAKYNNTVNFANGLHLVSGTYLVRIQDGNASTVRDCALDASFISVHSPTNNWADFRFSCSPSTATDRYYDNRRLFINAPMFSGNDAGVVFGVKGNYGTNLTFVINGDCSEYMGRIRTRGARDLPLGQWDTRVGFGDITVGGMLWVQESTAISAWKGVFGDPSAPGTPTECTVGAIYFKTNSVILVEGNTTTPTNGIFHVRGSVTVEQRPAGMTDPSVTVRFNYNPYIPTATNRVTVLTVPMASDLSAKDFRLDLGDFETSWPFWEMEVVEDPESQTKSLVAVFAPYVLQIASYTGEGRKAYNEIAGEGSSLTNAFAWSNKDVPGPAYSGYHYYSGTSYDLRTLNDVNADYDFPCLSFTKEGQSKHLVIDTRSFRVPVFNAGQLGCIVWLGRASGITRTLKADRLVNNANPTKGSVVLGAWYSQTMVIDAEVVGSGDFLLQGITGTTATKGDYVFTGLNTNFAGRISVEHTCQSGSDGQVVWDFATRFQTLYVNDGRNLGGAREVFSYRALMLQNMSRLSVTNGTVTLESGLNRGIYIDGLGKEAGNPGGRLFVDADCTFVVNWPITLNGKLMKEGSGTLVLGGEAMFLGGNPKASSNLFEVAEGTLKVTAYNAIDGMKTTFDSGTSLVLAIDPMNEELTRYGIRNAKTDEPFVLGAGVAKLPLSLDVSAYRTTSIQDMPDVTFGIVTVRAAVADSVEAMLPSADSFMLFTRGEQEWVRRDNDDGTVTFGVHVLHNGFTLMFM